MTHTHIPNAHLPRLSENRIEQMATFAASHAQDVTADTPSFTVRVQQLFASPARVFAGAGIASAAMAYLIILISTPAHTPSIPSSTEISRSENTISEYIIQDFLDEMV